MALITEFRSTIKAIEEGNFECIDFVTFNKIFQNDAFKFGDHLQFALQKFCKQSECKEVEALVIKLSRLCFSAESVSGFNNMDRFLGSLSHITTYFLKRDSHEMALEICKAIDYKQFEIEKTVLESQSTRNLLYILHSNFIAAAQEILLDTKKMNHELSYELCMTSLRFLKLLKSKYHELGRKIFRNFKSYLCVIKSVNKKAVYELYRNVEDVLNNLMPIYKENDFLLYYIIKMDLVENEGNMEVKDVINYFKRHLNILTVLMNDSKSEKYWDLILSEDITSERYFNDLVTAVCKLGMLKNPKLHLLVFSVVFNHINQLWIKFNSSDWNEVFSAKIIQKLYSGMMLPMKGSLKNLSVLCRLAEYQMDICFSDFYTMNLLRMLHMIRFCLKYNVPGCLDLVCISRELFKIIRNNLSEMKNQCCLGRKRQCWNNLVIHYTNTVEGLLRHSDSNKAWTLMRDCSEELLCEIINGEYELPYEWRRVKILFQRWHYACMKLKDYNEALFICTFYIISYPEEEEDALSMWIQTKMSVTSNIDQARSFKDVIDAEVDRMKCMNPKCEPLGQDLKRLLLMELTAYASCPSFSFRNSSAVMSSVVNLWEILRNLDLKLWERAAALNYVIVSTISSADVNAINKYKKDCENVVNDILRSKKKFHCRSLMYAGNLKYSLFLCHLKSVQEAEDHAASKGVLEYLKKEEEEKVKFGEVVDLNLTCNVMPSSNHFTVAFEENYLTALNETLTLWQEAVEMTKSNSLEPHEFKCWLHNIKQISQMYYLIGDIHQSFMSWLLYYRVAKICGNLSSILLGLSHLIPEYSNVDNSQILQEGEEIANVLSTSNKEKDILIAYWLSVGFNYLRNRNEKRCFYYLQKAKNVIGSLQGSTMTYLCHARYWCVVSKFLTLYHEHVEEFGLKPDTELRSIAFKAFSYANTAVKDGSICSLGSSEYSEILLTMLEVNVWASRFFGVYYQAAFMRFFLDDLYQIFQKLVLPTRTAYILFLLAEVDVMCEKVDDSSTKLSSLKSILGMSSLPCTEEGILDRKKSEMLEVPAKMDEEKESPRALSPVRFLDVHDSRERDPSPLRFVLADVDPKRHVHSAKCTCYSCSNLLIRFLWMNALFLEAQVNQLNGLIKKSCIYYKECYTSQKKLECYQVELSTRIGKSVAEFTGVLDFQGDMIKVNTVMFLTNYALFMLSPMLKNDVTEDVNKVIVKIDKAMRMLSFEQKLLQWRVLELKLVALTIHNFKSEEEEAEKEIVPAQIRGSPSPVPMKTPHVPQNPKENAAPMKYKLTNKTKSPNNFISKPSGRKIFDQEEEAKPCKEVGKKTPINAKKTARRKVEVAKVLPKKSTRRKMAAAAADVQ